MFFLFIPYAITYGYSKLKETWKGVLVLIMTLVVLFLQFQITSLIFNILYVEGTYYALIISLFILHATGIPWTFYLIKKYETDRDDIKNCLKK